MADVKTTYTSDISRVEANNRKLERQNQRLIDQNRRLRSASRSTSRAHTGAITSLKTYAIGMASTYLSVYRVLGMVKEELQAIEQLRTQAAQKTMTIAEAKAMAIQMAPGVVSEAKMTKDMQALAKATPPKGGMVTLWNMLANAMSASGDYETAKGAVEKALQYDRYNPENAQKIAGGLIDMRLLTGRMDTDANLGLLQAGTTQARIPSMGRYAQYAVRSALGVQATGGGSEMAIGLVSAGTKILGDLRGRLATRSMVWLAEHLNEALPEEDLVKTVEDPRTGRYVSHVVAKGTGLKNWYERIQYLRDPEHKEDLATFEAEHLKHAPLTARGGMMGIFGLSKKAEANEMAWRTIEDTLAAIPIDRQAQVKLGREKIEQMNRAPELKIARAGYESQYTGERQVMETDYGKKTAEAGLYTWGGESGLEKKLRLSGMVGPRLWWERMRFAASRRQFPQYAQILGEQAERLRGRRPFENMAFAGMAPPWMQPMAMMPALLGAHGRLGRETTPTESERAQVIEEHLREQTEILRRQADQNDRQIDLMQQGGAQNGHVAAQAQLGVGGE